MRTTFIAAVLLATASWTDAQSATVFVADEGSGSITVIETSSGRSKRIEIPIAPHNVDVTSDGARLLATGIAGQHAHAAHRLASGQLIVIDITEETAEKRIIEVGGHHAHVVPDSTGQLAYVTDAETHSVVVADLRDMRVTGRIPVGAYPHGLRLSPDGRTLAVANMRSGTVSLVDTVEQKQVAEIDVGRRPGCALRAAGPASARATRD